jgi:recombination associated protein RdgC
MSWFKNLTIHQIEGFSLDAEELSRRLAANLFTPCTEHEVSRKGWVSPINEQSEQLVYECMGGMLICLKSERKDLPARVVNQKLKERIAARQAELGEGEVVGREERQSMREEVILELIPKCFSTHDHLKAYIDCKAGLVVIDSASEKEAEQLMETLRSHIGDAATTRPVGVMNSIPEVMSNWIRNQDLPEGLEAGLRCKVCNRGESGSIAYQNQDLVNDERLRGYLDDNKYISELELLWEDKLQFRFTEKFVFKGVKAQNTLKEEIQEASGEANVQRLDAEFALLLGNVRELYGAITHMFGGEARAGG